MKKIIVLNSAARHGKDTLASYMYKELESANKTCLISHNAKVVKDLAYNFYNWDGYKDDKGRKLLIDITNTGYSYDEFFWEKKNMINELDREIYIIPDCRFISTIEYFEKEGYEVIKVHIVRPNFDNGLSYELKNDKSEQGFKDFKFDYEVTNKGLDDLRLAAKNIIHDIMKD